MLIKPREEADASQGPELVAPKRVRRPRDRIESTGPQHDMPQHE